MNAEEIKMCKYCGCSATAYSICVNGKRKHITLCDNRICPMHYLDNAYCSENTEAQSIKRWNDNCGKDVGAIKRYAETPCVKISVVEIERGVKDGR